MGRVVDLWAADVVEALRGSGSVVRLADGLDVDRWRRAGRRLESSVRTGVAANGLDGLVGAAELRANGLRPSRGRSRPR